MTAEKTLETIKEVMENGGKKEIQSGQEKDHFKEIVAYIEKTDLEYVEIQKDGRKISFRRSTATVPDRRGAEPSRADAEEEKPKFFTIRSPIVGRFHTSMGSDRPSLVMEGEHITAGQKVAIVEAMKIKKEVFSAVTGKVLKIHVRDGDAVEYGQELFSVEPQDAGGE